MKILKETRDLIEQKIALDWHGPRIAEHVGVGLPVVAQVRRDMNDLAGVDDVFDLFGPTRGGDVCGKGLHRMTDANSIRRPGHGRLCRACKVERDAERYRLRVAA